MLIQYSSRRANMLCLIGRRPVRGAAARRRGAAAGAFVQAVRGGRRRCGFLTAWFRNGRCRSGRFSRFVGCEHRRLEPDQQHFAIAVEPGGGPRFDQRERRRGGALHFRDLRHRVARREHAAEAGRDQQVAFLQVAFDGDERQRQLVLVAGADRDGAHAAAFDCTGNRVLGVGDQDDFGRDALTFVTWPKMPSPSSTAWPLNTPFDRALVEQHAVPERIEVDVEDLGDEHLLGDALRCSRACRAGAGSLPPAPRSAAAAGWPGAAGR